MTTANGTTVSVSGSQPNLSLLERFIVVVALLHGAGALHTLAEMVSPGLGADMDTPLWLTLYAWAGGMLFVRHGVRWIFWFMRFRFLLVLVLGAALASVLWSVSASLTFQRTIHLTGTTLIGCYIGYHVPLGQLRSLLAWTLGVLLLGGALLAVTVPEVGQEDYEGAQVWRGLETQKNHFGLTAAIGALFFAIRGTSEPAYWLLALVAFLDLLMSHSATSWGGLFVSAFVVTAFLLTNMLRLNWVATLSLLGTLGGLGVVLLSAVDLGELATRMGRSPDFTGRTGVWGKVWTLLEEHPWLGMGYGSIWFPAPGTESVRNAMLGMPHWFPAHAHNGFLQIASELGLPVAILAVLFVFQAFVEPIALYSQRPSPFVLFVIGLQCTFLVSNAFSALLFISRSFHWILFIAVSVALLRAIQHQRISSQRRVYEN